MPRGAGKYDESCQELLFKYHADAVILVVLNGDRGNGFSVNSLSEAINRGLPDMLRHLADEIDQSL